MDYKGEGIRHIEINKKEKEYRDNDNDSDSGSSYTSDTATSVTSDESDSDNDHSESDKKSYSDEDDKPFDKKEHFPSDNKEAEDILSRQNKNDTKKSSNKVNFDSLFKAVIDISDQIEDQERKLQQFEERDKNTRYKKNFPGKKDRPRTAVLQYCDESEFSTFDTPDSDNESVPSSSVSRTSSAKRRSHFGSTHHKQTESTSSRMNMSFSNTQVRSIDTENQRLLKQLLQTKLSKPPTEVKKKPKPVRVQSASSINRAKRQQEVERENLRMLHRLQSVKATSGLSRGSLLTEHSKQEQYSGRIGKARPASATTSKRRPISASLRPSSGREVNNRFYFDDSASMVSTLSSVSRRSGSNKISRSNLERQQNWNDRW